MKKQIWEIGGMNSVPPQKIDNQRINTQEENYLVFEILEDGQLGFLIPNINNKYLHIYNRISYSKDKKTWIHPNIDEYIPVKKGEIWYCKGECLSVVNSGNNISGIGQFNGISDVTQIKYNVSGNISSILDIRKENPDAEKLLIELIEVLVGDEEAEELLKQQSPEEAAISVFGEDALMIDAIKYSDKNKTPAHFRNFIVSSEFVSDEPNLSDEEFIRHVISTGKDELSIEVVQKSLSKSCITQCMILSLIIGYTECSPKLDELFQSEGIVDASGLVIDYSTTCSRMFADCYNLIKAPKLPMTTLLPRCYSAMFSRCTSLTTAPELPATTLAHHCYTGMFNGCTSLITAPELPATTLANYCYEQIFYDCISLTTAPELPATILSENCYLNMFDSCTSLTIAPELPATTLANYCYEQMFNRCTSLVNAPVLPATTLTDGCYKSMFRNCTSLINAPALPATTLASACYEYMFSGCTGLTSTPALSATTLDRYCYHEMFRWCSKLNNITMLATDISAHYCLSDWVNGVSATGTFVKHPDMASLPTGDSGIPKGWTVEDAII